MYILELNSFKKVFGTKINNLGRKYVSVAY